MADRRHASTVKGGMTMAMEAIEKVTQTEQEAARLKEEAAAEARQRVLRAEKDGRVLLEQAVREARTQAARLLEQAEQEAGHQVARIRDEAAQDCSTLQQEARKRLEAAAALIVERVVNS